MTGLKALMIDAQVAKQQLLLFRLPNASAQPVQHVVECHRFSVGDRIRAHSWITHASTQGYGKLVFAIDEDPANSEPCEYVLVYRRDIPWAQWGVACRREGYEVWHATRGTTLGVFVKIQEAFDQILAYKL